MDAYHSSRISHENHIILDYDGATPIVWTENDRIYDTMSEARKGLSELAVYHFAQGISHLDHYASKEEVVSDYMDNLAFALDEAEEASGYWSVPGWYSDGNLILADADTGFSYDIYNYRIEIC